MGAGRNGGIEGQTEGGPNVQWLGRDAEIDSPARLLKHAQNGSFF